VRIYSGALNVRWFGAKGDGTSDDAAAIGRAGAAVTAGGTDLLFPPGNYLVSSNVTTSAGNRCRFASGGMLSLGSGVVFTFASPIEAAQNMQIFSGAGTVAFVKGTQPCVYPDWWGGNSYSGNNSPLQLAVNSASPAAIPVRLGNRTYNIGASGSNAPGVSSSNPDTIIVGDAEGQPFYPYNGAMPYQALINYLGTGAAIQIGVNPGSSYQFISNIRLENFTLMTTAQASYGIWLWCPQRSLISRVSVFGPTAASSQPTLPTTGIPSSGICCLLQGGVFNQIRESFFLGSGPAQGTPRPLQAIGLYVGSALGNASTTTHVYDCYIQQCYAAAWVETSFANFDNCVFENSQHGLYGNFGSLVRVHSSWFEDVGQTSPACEGVAMASGGAHITLRDSFANLYTVPLNGPQVSMAFQMDGQSRIDCDGLRLSASAPAISLFGGVLESTSSRSNLAGLRLGTNTTVTTLPASCLAATGDQTAPSVPVTYKNITFTDLQYRSYFFLAKAPTPNMNGVQLLTNMGGSTPAYNIPAGGWVVGMRAYCYNTVSGTWQVQVKVNASTVVLDTGMTAGGTVDVNRNVLSAPFAADAYFSAYMTTSGSYVGGDTYVEVIVACGNALT
jgi:hypothetical protein